MISPMRREPGTGRRRQARGPLLYTVPLTLAVSFLAVQASQILQLGGIAPLFDRYPVFLPGMCFAVLFIWTISCALLLLTGRAAPGVMLPSGLLVILSFINYFKLKYLGIPLFPTDFSLIGNGTYMLRVVDIRVIWTIMLTVLILAAAGIGLHFAIPKTRGHTAARLAAGAVLTVLAVLLALDMAGMRTAVFKRIGVFDRSANQVQNYNENGLVAGLLLNLGASVMDRPPDYGEGVMREIADAYEAREGIFRDNPNIIYILCESFSDPYDLSEDFSISGDPMPFIRGLGGEAFKSTLMTPQIGSKTANVEFELLASMGMRDIYQKSVLYQDNLQYKEHIWSMLDYLGSRGYETTAVHPYVRTFYKRDVVYDRMGFDRFLALEDIKSADRLYNNQYVPDAAVYKDVADIIKDSGAPQFFHIVTMQNHTPFPRDLYNEPEFEVSGIENQDVKSEYETYYQGVYYSDQALSRLFEALLALDERTIVVFYGDHQPYMAKMISTQEGAEGDPSLITEERFYKTPLVILDTDGLAENIADTEILSPHYVTPLLFSYLGFELHPYYVFLLEMCAELPVCERKFLKDKSMREVSAPDETQKRLLDRYNLIAYDFFEGKGFLDFKNNWR